MEQNDKHHIWLFAREIESQMRMAELSLTELEKLYIGHPEFTNLTWYHLESMVKSLIAMANILWPSTNKNPPKGRSRQLLQVFGLEDWVLPRDFRKTRNALEHFDEGLDDWMARTESGNLADRNVGPKNMIVGDIEHARTWDPRTGELSVFGSSVNLYETFSFMQGVTSEISRKYAGAR